MRTRRIWCFGEERRQAFLFQRVFSLVFWRHGRGGEDEEGIGTRWVVFGWPPWRKN
jgi:hypothetical protein